MARTLDDHSRTMGFGMRLFLMPEYRRFRHNFIKTVILRPNEKLLDFGCGVGLLEEFFMPRLPRGAQIIGADIGENLLRKALQRFSQVSSLHFVRIGEEGDLPFRAESFDVIATNLVSHLLSPPRKTRVYSEFLRVLRPGGRLVMAEIGRPYSWQGRIFQFCSHYFWWKIWPYEKNTVESLAGLIPAYLRSAGFAEVKKISQTKGFIDILDCRKSRS